MTTYSTGNPLGSTDPKDLFDNAENFDNALNGGYDTWVDRLGNPRQSVKSFESRFLAALTNVGLDFIGDYAAGIQVTEYNQVIRSGGRFWRLSASENMPYTTTGTGMPEGGAFVDIGDGYLRQELVNPVATYNNVVEMQADTTLAVGRKVSILSSADGGWGFYQVVPAASGRDFGFIYEDLTAPGLHAQLISGVVSEDKSVKIPSDFPDLESAVGFLSGMVNKNSVQVNVIIESGHTLTRGLKVKGKDLSWVVISSEDPTVTLDASFIGSSATESLSTLVNNCILSSINAVAPIWNILVDASSSPLAETFGLFYGEQSTGQVEPGKGVVNATQNAECRASRLSARQANFSGATGVPGQNQFYYGLTVTSGAVADVAGVDVSGSLSRGLNVSRGSVCYANYVNANGCAAEGVEVRRSFVSLQDGTATGCVNGLIVRAGSHAFAQSFDASSCERGLWVLEGSTLSANLATADSCTGDAFVASTGGRLDVSGGSGLAAGGSGIEVDGGAVVSAAGCNVSGAGDAGVSCINGSTVDFSSGVAINCSNFGVRAAEGSRISARGADCSGSGIPVVASGASVVDARSVNAANYTGTNGVLSLNGSNINFFSGIAQISGADASTDISVSNGSTITAVGSKGGLSKPSNAITVNGIIYK